MAGVIIIGIIVIVALWIAMTYNKLVSLRMKVKE